MDELQTVRASDSDPFQHALRIGRLQKLARMDLATHLGGDRWRLEPDLADTLRRIGERGDIIRTIQRELTARNLERAAADQIIFDPRTENLAPIVGRAVARGLADELNDRHYLIVDAVDGRTYYAAIGKGEAVGPTPAGSIVRITPRETGIRRADRTIAEVGAANGGRYTVDAHLKHDPSATEAFAETHVRRLEAMRRTMRSVEREPDGSWLIAGDHLDKASAFEARLAADRPLAVESLSALPIDKLPKVDAATWLDRELVEPITPIRDAGFGHEVRTAQALRRQWLIEQELADEHGDRTIYRAGLITALQRRELLRVSA